MRLFVSSPWSLRWRPSAVPGQATDEFLMLRVIRGRGSPRNVESQLDVIHLATALELSPLGGPEDTFVVCS